jgi:putative PIN family toxin of toxin-antitoxin system
MRITLDTNQLVRALIRPPGLATFIMAWEARRFVVVASAELIREYQIVLAYPEIAELIYPELRRIFLNQLLDEIELVDLPDIPAVCRDPDDDKVIATALIGMVDFLVTADGDLNSTFVADILRNEGITLITIDELIRSLDQ